MSSDPIWLSVTEGLLRGISLCNDRLSDESFASTIEYLFRTIDNAKQDQSTESDLDTIRSACQLDEPDFKLVLQTLSYLVKRSLKFMLKPSGLQADLTRSRLQLAENKCNAFVRCWIAATKIVLDALEGDEVSANQLEDVSWKVRAQLSSAPRQKDKLALGQLELRTSSKSVNLELNSEEIVEFYNQMERIQAELDAFGAKA